MKNIHLFLIYICTILVCTSCNKNDEILSEQPREKYSRSQEIRNIIGDAENLSFSISPQLENIPLTKEDMERIKRLASKTKSSVPRANSQDTPPSFSQQATNRNRAGYHEELIRIDNLDLIVALEWDASFNSSLDDEASSINFADIHISLKDAPSGYWYQIALKRWYYESPSLIYKGEGELCKYIDNEDHIQLIGFTFYIEPEYYGNGTNFRYTLEKL